MGLSLYNLTTSYNQFQELLNNDEIDQDTAKLALDSLEGAIQEKIPNIVKIIKMLEFEAKEIKAEEERLVKMRTSRENNVKWLKDYMKTGMETIKVDKIDPSTPTGYKVALQKNSRGSVIIPDETKVPASHITIIPEQKVPNKELIEQDLKAGKVFAWATYEVGKHVRIR